jgi:uncharacterized membrane protein
MMQKKVFIRKTGAGFGAALLMAATLLGSMPVNAATSDLDMSTDYPGIIVKAGDTVSFPIDFASYDGEAHDISLSTVELPDEWSGYFKGNSNEITQVHMDAPTDESKVTTADSLTTFSLTVADDAEAADYTVKLKADATDGCSDTLELTIQVVEEVRGESSLTTEYPAQEGTTGTSFSFDATLINNRADEQSYSLTVDAPQGWQVSFTPSGESTKVASLTVDSGSSQGMTISVTPPENVEKGEYTISCAAVSANDKLTTELSVTITGTYDVTLSTSDGRLSFDAYADKESAVTLTITNNGNVDLENLNLTSSASTDWDVTFSESTIDLLEAGATKEVTAYVTPDKDAITGDYVAVIQVSNNDTSDSAQFRVSVKTSTTWGIAAIAIIVVLVIGLGAIFKKYGRR